MFKIATTLHAVLIAVLIILYYTIKIRIKQALYLKLCLGGGG